MVGEMDYLNRFKPNALNPEYKTCQWISSASAQTPIPIDLTKRYLLVGHYTSASYYTYIGVWYIDKGVINQVYLYSPIGTVTISGTNLLVTGNSSSVPTMYILTQLD